MTNSGAQTWKACWVQALAGSNPASSANHDLVERWNDVTGTADHLSAAGTSQRRYARRVLGLGPSKVRGPAGEQAYLGAPSGPRRLPSGCRQRHGDRSRPGHRHRDRRCRVDRHEEQGAWLDAEIPVNRADCGLTYSPLRMASLNNTITVHDVF